MINNFSKYGFPFYRFPQSYYKNINYNKKVYSNANQNIEIDVSKKNSEKKKEPSKYSSVNPFFLNLGALSNKEEPLLDILGLKLYLDDLIILAILFILYKENVKDDMLFIVLLLLLVS